MAHLKALGMLGSVVRFSQICEKCRMIVGIVLYLNGFKEASEDQYYLILIISRSSRYHFRAFWVISEFYQYRLDHCGNILYYIICELSGQFLESYRPTIVSSKFQGN